LTLGKTGRAGAQSIETVAEPSEQFLWPRESDGSRRELHGGRPPVLLWVADRDPHPFRQTIRLHGSHDHAPALHRVEHPTAVPDLDEHKIRDAGDKRETEPVATPPVEIPDGAPLPVLRQVAPVPTASTATRTDPAPYVPGPATTAPVTTTAPRTVQARFYQRSEPVYPYEARKRRLQGTVVLEAVFGADGRLVGLEVKQSSGHPMLDKAAVAHGTQSFYSTTGQAERVLIPVEYRLITL